MNVLHNVGLGARAGAPLFSFIDGKIDFSERRKRTISSIEAMGIGDKKNEPVRRLSGGEQRRVATARTLAQQPQLILADEFLSELDEDNITIVLDTVNEYIQSSGAAMIIVEHDIERARRISTRLFQIINGILVPME